MNKLRLMLFFAVFLILSSLASADINLYISSRDVYNLNDDISLSASVSVDENVRGYLKSNLKCDDYNIDYYLIPVNLEANDVIDYDIPSLNLFDSMLGTCKVTVSLLSDTLSVIEKKSSSSFTVTDELTLGTTLNKFEFNPGDNVIIDGYVDYMIGDDVNDYTLDIYLDNNLLESMTKTSSIFDYTLKLGNDIKSNNHVIKINVEDSYGNKGESEISINVNPIQSELKLNLDKSDFYPGEEVSFGYSLYDQGSELLYSDVSVEIYNPENELVLKEDSNTNDKTVYLLDKYILPGTYKIKISNDEFKTENEFVVLEVKNVSIYLVDGVLYIQNEGNVRFEDKIFIDVGEFGFFVDVNLDVNEAKNILLVDEVEDGNYNLMITANNKKFDLGEVNIKDDRTLEEKIKNKITGNVVLSGLTGALSDDYAWIYIIILLIVLGGLWYYLTFSKRSAKMRKIGLADGKKTLERIKAEKAKSMAVDNKKGRRGSSEGRFGMFN